MKYPDRQRKTIGIGVIGTKSWLRLSHRREPTPLSPPPFTIVGWHSDDGSAASTPSIQPAHTHGTVSDKPLGQVGIHNSVNGSPSRGRLLCLRELRAMSLPE